VLHMGVHSAVTDQPQQMEGAAIVDRALDRPVQRGVGRKLPVRHRQVDPGQPLIDDEAGADVGVPDLRVPHLPRRQPDVLTGGKQGRVRVVGPETVHRRRPGAEDGVSRLVAADTPAIEDHQDDWAPRPMPARSAGHFLVNSRSNRSLIPVLHLAIARGYPVRRNGLLPCTSVH
jgi:hypothetical protein